MGFSLLFPAVTVTSLLDDDDRKPTSMLLVANMVTVLAPELGLATLLAVVGKEVLYWGFSIHLIYCHWQ